MHHPTPLAALVECARKRRLLTRTQAERLAGFGVTKELSSVAALRNWLGAADGLHPDLARKLLALLPAPDQTPFGAYQPLAHLADGGMGSVWLASAADRPDLVVVKTIKPAGGIVQSESHAAEALRRFDREARITRQLAHPNVVRCLDNGVTDRQIMYLVLEYVDSGDLRDLVDAKGGLAEPLALAILYQVADGLAEAQRLKLVHRDIKPPNIFVASNGMAKLADFGIARSTESTRTMLTMEGAIVGSPLYMSPEQILTDPTLDIRSDIYALGAVLYFCLAAEAPYGGKLQEILHQHCTAPLPDVRLKRPKLSDASHAIINRAMAKDRTKRFQTPAELRSAISEALKHLGMETGAHREESTALRDLSVGTVQSATRDIAILTADLRKQAGLDEMETINEPVPASADQATIAADLAAADGAPAPLPSAEQMTIAADLNLGGGVATAEQMTIAADLNLLTDAPRITPDPTNRSELPTIAANLNAMATMTAVLLAQEPSARTPPPLPASKDPATSVTVMESGLGTVARLLYGEPAATTPAPAGLPLTGDPATALASPWLALAPAGGPSAPDQPLVFLFAQPAVRMGKLRETPVDLCLRNYPVPVHKEACQRLSRSHCALRYDALGQQVLIEDLGAPNGTRLDGIPLAANSSVALAPGVDNIVDLAGVVVLWLRCLPRTGPRSPSPAGLAAGTVGLDTDNGFDAVVITRPENRPELAYAQVLRRLSIGGPGADLPLAGARTRSACELAVAGGRWLWRPVAGPGAAAGPWQPLTATTDLDCGGRLLRAAPARHEQYG